MEIKVKKMSEHSVKTYKNLNVGDKKTEKSRK